MVSTRSVEGLLPVLGPLSVLGPFGDGEAFAGEHVCYHRSGVAYQGSAVQDIWEIAPRFAS